MWENWSGSVTCTPESIRCPETEDALTAIIREAREHGKRIRTVGAGHSFMPLAKTDEILLSLDRMQGIISVEGEQVTVWAGTQIKALGQLLAAEGLAQENLGDIDVQSIAGAISTGTHGTGAQLGNIATQVTALRLITASGEVVDCSETHNREVFKAAQISLGALGVITRVTLRCVPAFTLDYRWQKTTLDDLLANLDAYKRDNRNFEFFWIPHTNAALAKFMNITAEAPRKRSAFRQFNENVIENGVLWLLSATARALPARSKDVARVMGGLISSGHDITASHDTFATVRVVKFQEMEYNIPAEHFEACLHEVERTIREKEIEVHFPVECRFVKGDDIPLSPAFERDSAYIAVHMFKGMAYEDYFQQMEAIFHRYEGRPHWGKMNTLAAEDFARLYPCWSDFAHVREALDPNGLFLNAYLRRALLSEKESH